eukprot:scaffold296296_cov29-Prasinocladus_malaysianus.AAC.1
MASLNTQDWKAVCGCLGDSFLVKHAMVPSSIQLFLAEHSIDVETVCSILWLSAAAAAKNRY